MHLGILLRVDGAAGGRAVVLIAAVGGRQHALRHVDRAARTGGDGVLEIYLRQLERPGARDHGGGRLDGRAVNRDARVIAAGELQGGALENVE